MISKSLLSVHETLKNNGILICFSGRLSQTLIEEYGEAVRKYLEAEEHPKTEIFNVFSIFIELTQNIKNYSHTKESSPNGQQIAFSSIVTIGKTDNRSFVCAGNLIENHDVNALIEKLTKINQLDKVGLKQLYKDTLKQEIVTETNGAGLGLIDIARKASYPIEFSVSEMNQDLSFFTLKAIV